MCSLKPNCPLLVSGEVCLYNTNICDQYKSLLTKHKKSWENHTAITDGRNLE